MVSQDGEPEIDAAELAVKMDRIDEKYAALVDHVSG